MNEATILALGIGITIGTIIAYVMLSQNRTIQSPYRYEIERDTEGRMSGLAYIPIPIEVRV